MQEHVSLAYGSMAAKSIHLSNFWSVYIVVSMAKNTSKKKNIKPRISPPQYADLENISKEMRVHKIHELAKSGSLDLVPSKYLTTSYLTKFIAGEDKTAIHYAAEKNTLDLLFAPSFTTRNLLLRDKNGNCACDELLKANYHQLIPKSYYTTENLGIKTGKIFPKLLLVIKNGGLKSVPRKMFNNAFLEQRISEYNLIEETCRYTALYAIPRRLLTTKLMTRKYNSDESVLRMAAAGGNLAAIPEKVLTDRRITPADKAFILNEALEYNELELLPKRFFDDKFLQFIQEKEIHLLHRMASRGLGITLKILPTKALDIRTVPDLAKMALSDDNKDLGSAKHWYRHFGHASSEELKEMHNQLPVEMQSTFCPILEKILEAKSCKSKMLEAIQEMTQAEKFLLNPALTHRATRKTRSSGC